VVTSIAMRPRRGRAVLVAAALGMLWAPAAFAAPAKDARTGGWLGEDLPLPLPVRSPQDLAVKAVIERQYLLFNLLASGKIAWDAGDYATAAAKWETLLRLPGVDAEIDRHIRPLAAEARAKAGGTAAMLPPVPSAPAASVVTSPPTAPVSSGAVGTMPSVLASATAADRVTISGTVSGGGAAGPGGAVLWLRRTDGRTPRPAPARGKIVSQRGKTFIPRVLAVTVGTKVDFRNDDEIFHNVFSLSRPNDFDTGLYKAGGSYTQTFKQPGPIQLLCNIHSSMIGYVYVVDTPYYAQADAGGAFSIKGVPTGEYELGAWHEAASKIAKQTLTVGPGGLRGVSIQIAGDKKAPAFVPDKSGRPRQPQLGY